MDADNYMAIARISKDNRVICSENYSLILEF